MSMGLKANADGSGAVQVGGSDAITITSGLAVSIPQTLSVSGTGSVAGNFSFNSGYGSAARAYGCRAWVNFNGTGTIAIRASGNVTSITDNGVGDYTVNFTTAMPDANYAVSLGGGTDNTGGTNFTGLGIHVTSPRTASSIRLANTALGGSANSDADNPECHVAIFR